MPRKALAPALALAMAMAMASKSFTSFVPPVVEPRLTMSRQAATSGVPGCAVAVPLVVAAGVASLGLLKPRPSAACRAQLVRLKAEKESKEAEEEEEEEDDLDDLVMEDEEDSDDEDELEEDDFEADDGVVYGEDELDDTFFKADEEGEPLEARCKARFLKGSPWKFRRVLWQIRGRSYRNALMLLEFMPWRACAPTLCALQSAAANAQNHFNMDKSRLYVYSCKADRGPYSRRMRPMSKGQPHAYRRRSTHLEIVVREMSDEKLMEMKEFD